MTNNKITYNVKMDGEIITTINLPRVVSVSQRNMARAELADRYSVGKNCFTLRPASALLPINVSNFFK